jgi:DNA-binding NarL/FixJ family response regulator
MTRIVLIDDHNLFRAGIKALLMAEPDLSVVAEAATAEEGFQAVQSHSCDLVVVDYNLPDQDGPGLITRIRRYFPDLPILLLSQHTDFDRVREVMDCGCHGYMVKSADEHDLLTALRLVAAGGIYVHPIVAPALLIRGPEEEEFSSRQKAVMRLVATGCSNQDIADRLHVSLGTVKRDLSILFERTGVSDRTQLLVEAITRRLVEPSP